MIVDLQKFCDDAGINFRIKSPFSKGEWTYATNGHIMIRVPLIAGHRKDGPNAEKLYTDAMRTPGELVPFVIPELPALSIESEECVKCDGSGNKHDCPACDCDCEECDGSGQVKSVSDKQVSVQIAGVPFACEYIRLLGELPGLRLREPLKEKPLLFAFDGGEGMLMPLRSSREKSIKVRFKRSAPANGAVCVPPIQPDGESIADASGFEGGKP